MRTTKTIVRMLELGKARCTKCAAKANGAALVAPDSWGFYCTKHQEEAEKVAHAIGKELAFARAKHNPDGLSSTTIAKAGTQCHS